MTETEKKALALVNEVALRRVSDIGGCYHHELEKALCRAIEQHEAFRQEVSDAVEDVRRVVKPLAWDQAIRPLISRFIIAKPDPLVEVLSEAFKRESCESEADQLRAAIEARGGRIVWEGE